MVNRMKRPFAGGKGGTSKEKILSVVADVDIKTADFVVVRGEFIRLVVRPKKKRGERVHSLLIFDHRPATLKAVQKNIISRGDLYRIDTLGGSSLHRELKKHQSVAEAVNMPAKVMVIRRRRGDGISHYINLYHPEGARSEALLHECVCAKDEIIRDSSLWGWKGESDSRRARFATTFVTLTDETHKVLLGGRRSHYIIVAGRFVRTVERMEAFSDVEEMDGLQI